MKRIQANTQQLDAELMMPFLLQAGANAEAPGASAELASLAADPEVAEALARLGAWDFSTPTGIPEGYDGSDVDGARESRGEPCRGGGQRRGDTLQRLAGTRVKDTMVRAVQAIGVRPASGNLRSVASRTCSPGIPSPESARRASTSSRSPPAWPRRNGVT